MFQTGKENALADIAFQQQIFFSFSQKESFSYDINGCRALLKQQLNGSISNDWLAIGAAHEISYILGNSCDAQIIFARPFGNPINEAGRIFVLHEDPSFVKHQNPSLKFTAYQIQNVAQNNIHGNG